MKNLLVVGLLTIGTAGTAQAQIPTTDIAAITAEAVGHIETILRWRDQYDQMRNQFDRLTETHDALTGVRNLGDIFDNPELRQYMPADWQQAYSALRSAGYEGLLRSGVDIYNENKVFDACEHYQLDDQRLNCEAKAVHGAQVQGDLVDTLDQIDLRKTQISSLQTKINLTTDPKAIGELSARIAIEQSAIANEASRLMVISNITDAEQRALAQRDREFQARTFAKTKGLGVEPLTFD